MTVPYTFGNEQSPIPLSQLDANFAVTPTFANTAGNVANAAQPNITSLGTLVALSVTGNVTGGNLRTAGSASITGNIAVGNIATGGIVSAFGNVTGGNFLTAGLISVVGNATVGNIATTSASVSGNLNAGGNITATGSISSQGNVVAQGIVSATGNIVTAGLFVGNFQGNIVGNITGAPGSSTQILFNTAGNVDAVGGLTYNKGSNTLSVLGTVSAQGNVVVGANLSVAGTTQLVGTVTAPTPTAGTVNNEVATAAFVNNRINGLGTMATQNANAVAITGGTITNLPEVNLAGGWAITPNDTTLYFSFNGFNVAKIDSEGNFTTIGNVTSSGVL
jgi:hypothetical protein